MAWILLAAPFGLVLLAWIFRAYSEMKQYDNSPEQYPAGAGNAVGYGCSCPCCGSMPCSCMRACPQANPCVRKPKPKCKPKNKPCSEDSYFELWLTTK